MEGGITGNPHDPDDHQNFGRVFDDRANEPMLNEVTATVERALAPEPGKFDYGFKLQAGYRLGRPVYQYAGHAGERDAHTSSMPYVVEAYGNLHIPIGKPTVSTDFKFGQFATIIGAETIDPRTNYFYSHDYIFNFGIPLQHLGGLCHAAHQSDARHLRRGDARGEHLDLRQQRQGGVPGRASA